jgi:hypothetical protein
LNRWESVTAGIRTPDDKEAVAMEDIQERYRDLSTRIGNLWEYL